MGDASANAEGLPSPAKLLCQISAHFSLYVGVKCMNWSTKESVNLCFHCSLSLEEREEYTGREQEMRG